MSDRSEDFQAPSGQEIAKWNEAQTGGGAELIAEWRATLEHQRRLEDREWKLVVLGPSMGFLIAMSFLAATVYLITSGNPIPGTLLGTLDLVALVSVFVLGPTAPPIG
jgi:hypothetical protein